MPVSGPLGLDAVACVLLDIEGTVCPISFVRETLVPYAQTALPAVLDRDWDSPLFAPYRDAFPEDARASPAALRAHVDDLSARDSKDGPLKAMQGYLWRAGYASGDLAAPLYSDVPIALHRWREAGAALAIYSSGSVDAQKLLFANVRVLDENGSQTDSNAPVTDLTTLMSGWFDTHNAGPKIDAASYRTISEALQHAPKEILFLSDNVLEVDAAHKTGMQAFVVQRPGNASLAESDIARLSIVTSFADIEINTATPRAVA